MIPTPNFKVLKQRLNWILKSPHSLGLNTIIKLWKLN